MADLAPAADPHELAHEIAHLRGPACLASIGTMRVLLAPAARIPATLREIGRLRETCFRAVGEGTGRALDLDEFDAHYLHLFLWDSQRRIVAGAYRLGPTDLILAKFGRPGLYTSTLFEFEPPFLDHLNPGLELGRSFVAPAYQRSVGALAGLWKGIGRFITRNPRYQKLFGPVSISRDYTPISRDLIVHFLRTTRRDPSLSPLVRPLHPFAPGTTEPALISPHLNSIEEVSARIAEVEPDGKGVPVLLRQYLKLNATLLEFNVDPVFSNCLDALLLVDLRHAPPRLVQRFTA
jgi:hypothetical protein